MRESAGPGNLDGHVVACRKRNHIGQIGERLGRRWWLPGLGHTDMINHLLGVRMEACQFEKKRQLARTHNIHWNTRLGAGGKHSIDPWVVRSA